LATVDPDVVGRLDRGDTQRLLRAAGVWLATGRSLSSWQAAGRKAPTICGRRLAPVTLLLSPERSVLYAAIEQRFDAMMAGGGLAEVQRLAHLGLDRRRPVMRALGVPQLLDHLQGHMPLHQAVAEAKTLSRRYAKRQITWFRHRYPVANFTPITQLSESFIEEIISEIRKLELTPSSAATSFSLPSG